MPENNLMYFGFNEEQRQVIQSQISNGCGMGACITHEPTNIDKKIYNINECRTGTYLFRSERPNLAFERLYSRNRYKLIKIAARQQIEQGALSFDSLDCFVNRLKVSVNGLMTIENPSLVYSSTWPQCAFDYLVLLWCQSNNKKFIFEEVIPYFNRIVPMESRCESPAWESISAFSEILLQSDQVISSRQQTFKDVKDQIETLRSGFGTSYQSYVPGLVEQYSKMTKTSIVINGTKWILRHIRNLVSIFLGRSEQIGYTGFRMEKAGEGLRLRNMRMRTLLLKSFRSYSWSSKIRRIYRLYETPVEEIRKLSTNSVVITYFAGQEPESSILCGSGSIQSNLAALELLLAVLPDNHVIVYKEHLSALFFHDYLSKGAEPENKIIEGLIDLIKEKRVLLAPLECNKFDLLNISSGVSTTIGNIGFEATLMGLPVLTLGKPWYFTSNFHFDLDNRDSFFAKTNARCRSKDLSPLIDHLSRLLTYSVTRESPKSFSFLSQTRVNRASYEYKELLSAMNSLITTRKRSH